MDPALLRDGVKPRGAMGQALAFKAYAEVMRKYPNRDLRVALLRPGGGQYRCISLLEGRFEQSLTMLNLDGTSLQVGAVTLRWPNFLDANQSLATTIEECLGWKPSDARVESTQPAISIAVLAELTARYALSPVRVELDCGWLDSSGYGTGVQTWAQHHPRVAPRLKAGGSHWQNQAAASARLWAIIDDAGAPKVILDVPTGEISDGMGRTHWSIRDEFNGGAGIRALAWRLEGNWREGF